MSTEIKKYEVIILGESYTLASDQNEEHIQAATHKVDEIVKEISQKAPHLEQKKVVVFAAIKVASMLIASEYNLKDVKSREQALLDKLDQELPTSLFV